MNMRLSLTNVYGAGIGICLLIVMALGFAIINTDDKNTPVVQGLIKQRWYDPARIMQQSQELSDKEKEFESKFTAKAQEFKKRAEDIQKESAELQKKQAVISADAYKQEREKLEERYNRLSSEAQYSEKKMQQELGQIRGEYERKLLDLIKEFKDKNKIDVIQPIIPGTFVNKELDVTDQLAEFVNAKYKAEKAKSKPAAQSDKK